ncbi:UvrD-helicase domain-containing protein [Sutcliffiella sp. NC1]|uniref:UvrD-helicase domain-containing protein n=1 Tax=Sutcliffiella sp. NC1 TaxID=3004096 RepID=UPI0022DD5BDD|nr:UvrD-helicase domain-containing protein [Sutcliffiella sp. NC1]WBL16856.1 UvrD-helicase domain-containing protein [Sutcliffiella sp. NC1]
MMSFWNTVQNKIALFKYVPELRKQLNLLEEKMLELQKLSKVVKSTRATIPDTFLQHVEESHEDILAFINEKDLYNFDAKLKQVLSPMSSEERTLIKLEEKYASLSEQYVKEKEALQGEIRLTNAKIKLYEANLTDFKEEIKENREEYITHSNYNQLKQKYGDTYSFYDDSSSNNSNINDFLYHYKTLDQLVKVWNDEYVRKELAANDRYFNDIDGKSLDKQQRKSIIVDEDSKLIVASAGAGKTLTISGKVKYLVEKKGVKPEEILLVSFTRKAANEMEERIKQRLNINVEVKTFHKLGLDIISKSTKAKPDIVEQPSEIIKQYFHNELYDNPQQIKKMIEFFGYYLNIPKSLEEFDSLGDSYDYQKSIDLETLKSKYDGAEEKYVQAKSNKLKAAKTTIQGERVKSLEEVMIANFLFLNGIEYEYEKVYEHASANENYRRYRPDYYLPEYDIYIEHFGITEDERTPWLSEIEEEKYLEGMKWKREEHEKNGTTLIETYSYLSNDGRLLDVLKEKLKDNGVQFKEVDFIDIFSKVYDTANNNHFDEFIKFVGSFINLFKSNGYNEGQFNELVNSIDKGNLFHYMRTKIFLEIANLVFQFYEDELTRLGVIDFNDMVNEAASIVRSGKLDLTYKYIIIDEYQDISVSRYELIKEIREMTNAKVMCVGDDWQSIYRFAGSDINLFTEFQHYFGYSELLKIEKTYRNSQQLIDEAGKFVMKNPKQFRKDLTSFKETDEPIIIYSYLGKAGIISTIKASIDDIVTRDGEDVEVMLLGRNNFDIKVLDGSLDFDVKRKADGTTVKYETYPNLKLFFLTTHKSKGLEADYVILINTANSLLGFPNKISDDPILSLVLTDKEGYPFAEERRLFYVALTRTKNRTYILTPVNKMSVFVKELIDKHNIEVKTVDGTESITEAPSCPRCKKGHLEVRVNGSTNQKFLGCSNFPQCDYTLNDVRVLESKKVCPSCGGYMVLRRSAKGEFYGCSNYPKCGHIHYELEEQTGI